MSLRQILKAVIEKEAPGVAFAVESSGGPDRGDMASNVAMLSAKTEKKSPMEIGERLRGALLKNHPSIIKDVCVASPGFLNVTFHDAYIMKALAEKAKKPKSKGKASIEFVSANPTGPLHIGNARGGPIGDVLANLFKETGWSVRKEYFYNDAGAQVEKFSSALWYWYATRCGASLPADAIEYHGAYMQELAAKAFTKYGKKLLDDSRGKEKLLIFAFAVLYKENFATLKSAGIRFDRVTKESALVKNETPKAIAELENKRLLKHHDGAVWFAPLDEHLQDRETVVQKSDGTFVYFANDISYHRKKFREHNLVIDIFGEGHHGHIPKLRAIADAFSFPNENFRIVVHGQVQVVKDGKPMTMSKRLGNFVTAEEVLNEVGKDVFRYFLLQLAPKSAMQFDLALAKERSKKNPVYYIQYAYARASSILRKAGHVSPRATPNMLEERESRALALKILEREDVIHDTATDAEVQRVARYALELAQTFTVFYERSPVLDAPAHIRSGRVYLVKSFLRAMQKTGKTLGIRMPARM